LIRGRGFGEKLPTSGNVVEEQEASPQGDVAGVSISFAINEAPNFAIQRMASLS
jgi:hypothetical protein